MKNQRTPVLCVCMMLCSLYSFAQEPKQTVPINEPDYNKPKLFKDLPDNIPVNTDQLDNLLHATVGKNVNSHLSDKLPFTFEGEVISTASRTDNNTQTVVIRCTNYHGANLTLSKILHEDGSVGYTGRIISFQHGDLFELKNQKGQFVFVKRNYYDLVNE